MIKYPPPVFQKLFRLAATLVMLAAFPVFGAPGKIALIQYNADLFFGNSHHNLKRLTELSRQAVKRGANIIVFPEGSTHGYASPEHVWALDPTATFRGRTARLVDTVAEPIPTGPVSEHWRLFAKQNGVYIVYNIPELDQGRYFNTSAVMGPEGFVGKYQKRDLYIVDKLYAEAGAEPFVFSTPFGNFGLLICMDGQDYNKTFFDEYKRLGADGIILPMNWDDPPDSNISAKRTFARKARQTGFTIFVSDVSPWDGTGVYTPQGKRLREGLPRNAVHRDGVSYHVFDFAKNCGPLEID